MTTVGTPRRWACRSALVPIAPGVNACTRSGPNACSDSWILWLRRGGPKRLTPTEWYAAGPVPAVRIRTSWPVATSRSATCRTVPAVPVSRGSNDSVTRAIRRGLVGCLMCRACRRPAT